MNIGFSTLISGIGLIHPLLPVIELQELSAAQGREPATNQRMEVVAPPIDSGSVKALDLGVVRHGAGLGNDLLQHLFGKADFGKRTELIQGCPWIADQVFKRDQTVVLRVNPLILMVQVDDTPPTDYDSESQI
jgi:hypothetical protein